MKISTCSQAAVCLAALGLGLAAALPSAALATGAEEAGALTVAAAGDWNWVGAAGHPRRHGRAPVYLSPEDLEGTIWFSEQPHRRASVTLNGDVEVKEGKNLFVHFQDRIDDIFIIAVRWWNEAANINVLEYGLLTHIEGNQYSYTEADHTDPECDQAEFPGIVGRGTFELLSEDRAELIQVGHLIDGAASGFTTVVEKVDTLPVAPIEQTYPLACP